MAKIYTGEALKKPEKQDANRLELKFNFDGKTFKGIETTQVMDEKGEPLQEKIDPYFPSEDLVQAIELLRILERPILLRGEPGCGKTKVAQAVAYELYGKNYQRYYFEWHVKSTSKAQDGLYTFDYIARLRDANDTKAGKAGANGSGGQADNPKGDTDYRELGPLGKAFLASEKDSPAILLIDEIDKADIDFPNDLLLELDEMRFSIPETREEIIPKQKPLIFITSNQERELSPAFLRRCLFHYIKFPVADLGKIMEANFPSFKRQGKAGQAFLAKAIEKFTALREELNKNPSINKSVSTSELKDWVRILEHYFNAGKMDLHELEKIKTPYHMALLKTENDLKSLNLLER